MACHLPLRRRSAARLVRPLVLAVTTGLLGFALGSVPAAEAATIAVSGLVQERSSSVSLNGPWTTVSSAQAVGGSFANLNATGSASLTFRGTGVSWIARRSAHSGLATVYVDKKKVATVNLYAAATTYRTAVFTTRSLSNSTHTVKVVRTGKRSAASDGSNVVVDAFNVLDKVAPKSPTSVKVLPARTGATVTWARGAETDLATYRVTRTDAGGRSVVVGTLPGTATLFFDAGLPAAATYRYRVTALDTSGNASGSSATVSLSVPAAAPYATHRYADCPTATVGVSTMGQLQTAVNAAGPGTVISLAPGRYIGPLEVNVTGTAAEPVWICGPRTAVVQGWGPTKPGGIRVKGSSHVVIAGLTVRNSQKGIAVMGSDHVTLADNRVEDIGEEALHLKFMTTDSTVVGNSITRTGLMTAQFGEGVYIGTAKPNWCVYNNCQPDASSRNRVIGNTISHTTAEQIEAKEAAVDGLIADNILDGAGMDEPSSDSLIAIQTNGWTITGNTGVNSPNDGVQVWEAFAGDGQDNLVFANRFGGTMPGYAVRLAFHELGNIVGCDTEVAAGGKGLSNKPCQP